MTIRNVIPYASNEKSTVGIDAERLRASLAKLISSSTNELEKLIAELEALKAKRRLEEMTRTKLKILNGPRYFRPGRSSDTGPLSPHESAAPISSAPIPDTPLTSSRPL